MDHVMKSDFSPNNAVGTNMQSEKPPAEGLADQARNIARDVKDKASDLAQVVTRTAKTQAEGLSETASGLATDAMATVEGMMNDKKNAGAEYMGSIVGAAHRAANELEREAPLAGRYIHQAADRLADVANVARERDVRELLRDVQTFARKQPALVFGGTLLLGFAAVRLFKAAGSANSDSAEPRSVQSSPSTAPTTY